RCVGDSVLDAVRRHELVHVRDAAQMLPFIAHPLSVFLFGLSHGFDAEASERALEARAQATSMADAEEPCVAIAALVAFLPSREGDTPHAAAYREVAQAAVDIIVDDPSA